MFLRTSLFLARIAPIVRTAKLQCELALSVAIKEHQEFTVIGYQENGTILACLGNTWVEI